MPLFCYCVTPILRAPPVKKHHPIKGVDAEQHGGKTWIWKDPGSSPHNFLIHPAVNTSIPPHRQQLPSLP